MKNIYLTLLGAFFTMLPCKSQTLSDGKVWNFVQRMYEHEDIERAYTVTVCGDTIANGLLCKKLVKVTKTLPIYKQPMLYLKRILKYMAYMANKPNYFWISTWLLEIKPMKLVLSFRLTT